MTKNQTLHTKKYLLLNNKNKHKCIDCNKVINSRAKKTTLRCNKCYKIYNDIKTKEYHKKYSKEYHKKHYNHKIYDYTQDRKIFLLKNKGFEFSNISKLFDLSNREVRNCYNRYKQHKIRTDNIKQQKQHPNNMDFYFLEYFLPADPQTRQSDFWKNNTLDNTFFVVLTTKTTSFLLSSWD